MAERILIEDFEQEKAIELSDGTVLDIPQRTADLYEKITLINEKEEIREDELIGLKEDIEKMRKEIIKLNKELD